jgi:hypothetical protein
MPTPTIPEEALHKAQSVVESLREQLSKLFETLPPGYASAIRFEAGEDQ